LIKNSTWNIFGPRAVQTVLVKKSHRPLCNITARPEREYLLVV